MAYGSDTSSRLIDKLRSDVDGLVVRVAIIQDQKPSGTAGGKSLKNITADSTHFTADMTEYTADQTTVTWVNRDLNTIVSDEHDIIESLAGSTFTLGPGTYLIKATSVFHYTHGTLLQLHDATSDVKVAQSFNSYFENTVDGHLHVVGWVEPRKKTSYQLEYQVGRETSDGLGRANSFAGQPEIYSTVEIYQMADLKPDASS